MTQVTARDLQVTKLASGVATILFVNDQTYAMSVRADYLRTRGHVVLVADSAASALETLLNNPVDATVLDCHMLGAGEIADMLKRLRPQLPLVILASYCARPCPVLGTVEVCVAKAESPATLLETLQAVLVGETGEQEVA